ncbi:MAG TPA: bifunctional YncE family protein/alkaline phosphatase family protein [Blastocatellia bacterium]|nr:bifunctional YncE family protein/alkaline phosphatase family protein [Blastocatellia bacterium]
MRTQNLFARLKRYWIAIPLALVTLSVIRPAPRAADDDKSPTRLPTGAWLDPAGRSFDVGNMPLAMALAPEGNHFILSLNGWREQGVQVVERATGRVTQTLKQPAAFFGLAFSPDGQTLYASGGNQDAVYRYSWRDGKATPVDQIVLAEKKLHQDGTRFPAGLAMSRDGQQLYIAENIADMLAVVDVASKRIVQRLKTDHYPYAVAVSGDGNVYVSAWGGNSVSVFQTKAGQLAEAGKIVVGRHPSALALNAQGTRLFVACASADRVTVVDTTKRRVIKELQDSPPAGPREGSTPDALALAPDGTRLFVAEADNNAVAVFDLSTATAGATTKHAKDALAGRIPVGWYPTALVASADSLWVLNGKGRGTKANPDRRKPGESSDGPPTSYVLGQLDGTITELPLRPDAAGLQRWTARVGELNSWGRAQTRAAYPPFKHVIYIIKENRTYDQMFGDVAGGDGDPSLLFFPRTVTPNHRALAERFGLFDRFFVNAEVSAQGHQWSTSAYSTDYTEKVTPLTYSHRRAEPEDEGEVDEPINGYLWDAALRKGVTLRNYGEFAAPVKAKNPPPGSPRYRAVKAALAPHTHPDYPPFDMDISDQKRADVWLAELQTFVAKGTLPALEIIHLPCDHTSGARPGRRTPSAYVADNDLALARMMEALSKTPFWKETVVFVLEDDAQDGPDHVDSHRSVLMVISPYNRAGTLHRFVNTTDVVATMEEILGLEPLSQFVYYGRPLREIFAAEPDLRPYQALTPAQSLTELNPARGRNAAASLRLDFSKEDRADMALFNRVLWRAIKGEGVPYPGPKQMSPLEYIRGR